MLLTSAGVTTDRLCSTLDDLVGRPFAEAAVAMVVTAATADAGPHDWLVRDINRMYGLGWARFQIAGGPGDQLLGAGVAGLNRAYARIAMASAARAS